MKGSKSFKKWLALFMVVAMVCGLTACSSGSAGTTAAPENTTAAPTTTAAGVNGKNGLLQPWLLGWGCKGREIPATAVP